MALTADMIGLPRDRQISRLMGRPISPRMRMQRPGAPCGRGGSVHTVVRWGGHLHGDGPRTAARRMFCVTPERGSSQCRRGMGAAWAHGCAAVMAHTPCPSAACDTSRWCLRCDVSSDYGFWHGSVASRCVTYSSSITYYYYRTPLVLYTYRRSYYCYVIYRIS